MGYMNLVSFIGVFVGPFSRLVWEQTGSYKTRSLFLLQQLSSHAMMFLSEARKKA